MRRNLLLVAVSLLLQGKATSVAPDCIYDGRYFSGAAGDYEDLRGHCGKSRYGGAVSVAFTASMERVGGSSWDKVFDGSVDLGSMLFLAVSPDQHLNFQQHQQQQWITARVWVPLFEKHRYLITMSSSGYMKLWRNGVLEAQAQGFPLANVNRHLRISKDPWGDGELKGTVEDFWFWHSEVGWESARIDRTTTTTTAIWVAPFLTYEGRRFTGTSGDYENLGSHSFGGEISVAFTASMERISSQQSWDKVFDFSVGSMNNMLFVSFAPDQHLWFQMYQSGQWKICKVPAALNEKRRYLVTLSASGYMRLWRDGVLEAQAQAFPLAQGLRQRYISYDAWGSGWLQGTVEDLWVWHSLVGWESAVRTTTTTLVASTTTSRTWTSTTSLTGTSMTATSTVTSSTASSVTSTTETVTSMTVSTSTRTLTGTSTTVTSTTSRTTSSTQTGTTLTVTTTTTSTSTSTVTRTSTTVTATTTTTRSSTQTGTTMTVSVTTSSTSSTSLTGTSVTVTTSTSSTTSSTLTRTSLTVTSSTTSTRSSTSTVTSTTTATGSSTSSVSSVTATGTTTSTSLSTSTFSDAGLTSATVTHTSAEGESLSSTSLRTRSATTVTAPLLSQRVAKNSETTNVPKEDDHAPRKDLETHAEASAEVTSTVAQTSANSAMGATAMVRNTPALASASSAPTSASFASTSANAESTTASPAMGAAGRVQSSLDFVVMEIHLMGAAAAINMLDFVEQLTAAMPATLQLPSGDVTAMPRKTLDGAVLLEVDTAVQPAPEAAALSERLSSAADDISAALTLQLGGAAEIKAVRLGSQGLVAAASSGGTRARIWEGALLEVVEKGTKALLQQLQESNSTMLGTTVAGLVTVATRLDALAPSVGGEKGEQPDFIRVPLGLPGQQTELEVKLPVTLLASLQQRPNVSELALVASMPSLQAAQDAAVELATWLSIEIYQLQGQLLEISGLETAIEFTMDADYKPGLGCAFWDETQQRWSQEGVALGGGNVFGEPIFCKTEHLSLFGVVLNGFIETYICSQPALMTMDALFEVLRLDWLSSPGAILYWCLLAVLVTGFAMSVAIDHLRDGWMMWSDEFFLVPLQSSPVAQSQDAEEEVHRTEDDWSVKKVGYVLSSIAACLTCAMYCFRGAATFCKETALRDALDEIVSEYVEYFSEVRVVLEGLFADIAEVLLRGAETEALAAGRFGHVRQLMAQHMVLATARRLVGASMGLNGEVVEFVLDDKELLELLQKMAHYQTGDADHHPALDAAPMRSVGSDASEEELAVVQPVAPSTCHTSPGELLDQVMRLCEEGQHALPGKPESLQVVHRARRQQSRIAGPGSSKWRRSAFAKLAKGAGTRRMLQSSYAEGYSRFSRVEFAASPWHSCDSREDAWAALHDEILDHLTSHVAEHSWFSVLRMVRALFLVLNPLGGICTRSIFGTCRMRAFFHALELTGDLLVICIFHSGSVRGRSRGNTGQGSAGCGDDELSEEILYKVGRVMAIATAAVFIACLPVSFLKTLRTRHFKWLPWQGCDEWQKQLQVWETRDKLVWLLGSFYFFASHCLIVIFLANIAPEDHEEWTMTGAISLLQDAILFPLGTAILMPTVAAVMLSGESTAAQARRTRLIHKVNVRVHGGAPMQAIVSAI